MSKRDKNILAYFSLYLVFTASLLSLNYGFEENKANFKLNYQPSPEKFVKPDFVRGLYLTAYSAGRDEFRQNIIDKMKDSRINTVVIDIKDYSGYILYASDLDYLQQIKATKNRIPNISEVIDQFHQADIYVIARQTVFQDPILAKARPQLAMKTKAGNTWYDNNGLAWVDPGQSEVWQYNLDIAKEAAALGFDEINFDYMRYPSDGNMGNLNYNMPADKSRSQVLDEFFSFLSENLSGKTNISIDMFGLVMDHTDDDYDLNIGQRVTEAANHFDYVCPMMYPSHYPLTYLGYTNSAEHPGPVIAYGLRISEQALKDKRAKIRPWIQAFHMRATYDETKINAQIEAVENATTTEGWLLWNARNYYPDYIF